MDRLLANGEKTSNILLSIQNSKTKDAAVDKRMNHMWKYLCDRASYINGNPEGGIDLLAANGVYDEGGLLFLSAEAASSVGELLTPTMSMQFLNSMKILRDE
jgi:hypothetical protein